MSDGNIGCEYVMGILALMILFCKLDNESSDPMGGRVFHDRYYVILHGGVYLEFVTLRSCGLRCRVIW